MLHEPGHAEDMQTAKNCPRLPSRRIQILLDILIGKLHLVHCCWPGLLLLLLLWPCWLLLLQLLLCDASCQPPSQLL
jgi:hypothetical protein